MIQAAREYDRDADRPRHEITVAVPSYGREGVLVDTIASILGVAPPGTPVLIIDQTERHAEPVAVELQRLERSGQIRRVFLSPPSITRAMNHALEVAETSIVLFLDDDLLLEPGLIEAHAAAHRSEGVDLVAGRVIQPWQEGVDFSGSADFHFATLQRRYVSAFMGGNFSVKRSVALQLGGFDENFVRVAYNFEAEFAHRYLKSGREIFYEPAATIHHLKVSAGGTRSFGEHLRTMRPDHSVGAYYYEIRKWDGWKSAVAIARRPFKSIATRHHLKGPWWIPLTLIGEMRGLIWAIRLARRGPALINSRPAHSKGLDL